MVGVLLVLLVAVPILEIYVIVQVGEVIGIWWTVLALIVETVVGGWLVRREGRRAWRNLVVQLSEGQAPTRTAIDGAVILIGGLLLLAPGFITDFLGFLCVLPLTRPLVRRAVVGYVARRSGVVAVAREGHEPMTRPNRPTDSRVIEGHVVDRHDDESKGS